MNPRSEPLLWLQLVAFGAIPLELLLLLLLLAGADPGPLPGLERLLLWGLGVLAPTILLWRRPADCCSLLVVQVPAAGRSGLQKRLGELQAGLVPRLLFLLGSSLLLPLLWWLDTEAVLAAALSPLSDANRLISLLLAAPVLALLTWQCQQLSQSVWLLTRPTGALASPGPSSSAGQQRLSLGLPVLLLSPLPSDTPPPPAERSSAPPEAEPPAPEMAPSNPEEAGPSGPAAVAPEETAEAESTSAPAAPAPDPAPVEKAAEEASATPQDLAPSEVVEPIAIEPEQPAADEQGRDLDQEIP